MTTHFWCSISTLNGCIFVHPVEILMIRSYEASMPLVVIADGGNDTWALLDILYLLNFAIYMNMVSYCPKANAMSSFGHKFLELNIHLAFGVSFPITDNTTSIKRAKICWPPNTCLLVSNLWCETPSPLTQGLIDLLWHLIR